jgi:hypothetical protein
MGSMQFKGTNVHLHVDGAELCLGLPKSPELPKLTIEKPRTFTTKDTKAHEEQNCENQNLTADNADNTDLHRSKKAQ